MSGRTTISGKETVQFAGLTRHNNVELSEKAMRVSDDHLGLSDAAANRVYPDEMPDTSLSSALLDLERADDSALAWRVPDRVAERLDATEVEAHAPEDVRVRQTTDGGMYVETNRYMSIISPDKLEDWMRGNYQTEASGSEWRDPLWHVPTKTYSIVNPMDFYEPLEKQIREMEVDGDALGDCVFGEIRKTKGGGEVHMTLLFDCFNIDLGDKASGGPILLGIRTGYDYFGGTQLYAEGFAQDRYCKNSIKSITGKKTRKHVGDTEEIHEWWEDILREMELVTDRLAEAIEEANQIQLDYLDYEFAEVYDHDRDLQAFYELIGFPAGREDGGYLAGTAAKYAKDRAQNEFNPTFWDLHSGATYALTHEYRGNENTSRARTFLQIANDLLFNPTGILAEAENEIERIVARQQARADSDMLDVEEDDVVSELDEMTAMAKIQQTRDDIEEQRREFQTRQEELQAMLADETA